jgi:hypothetical protein
MHRRIDTGVIREILLLGHGVPFVVDAG